MSKTRLLTTLIVVCLAPALALSQTDDLPKFEVAAEFTTLERDAFNRQRTEPGLGGRFTYNINKIFALEAAAYFFPKECFECADGGRLFQTVGGVKIGKRFENWGIFAKARPGLVSNSEAERNLLPIGGPPTFPLELRLDRVNSFAMDVGGVVEFYPSRRIVTRFDVGDTMVHFTRRTTNDFFINPNTGFLEIGPVTRPARTTHSFQFIASVGFRF